MAAQWDGPALLLLLLAALGIFSSNSSVTIAAVVLLLLRVTRLHEVFPWLEKYGLTIGIVVLTIGVLAPVASGKYSLQAMGASFLQVKSLLAVVIGVLVSYLGGRGVTLMAGEPTIVVGLLTGTILGVALFGGVPVGPLIAAGLLTLLIGKGG
ncbi:DUF441 domain-containing protein [Paenibacillus aurantius]|uniref:UPF0756 membrane protein MJA45_12700 n=1 Tax=Paenibacillus aurantius TaxID=2918900 RepID=A0AA96LMA9_9BACL|nr:DUF441 domain-containing protein [Paenibacillus aurantius]WNQ13832.1 DUF441 domain-containing protein [Paenibacillus aurantius]